MELTGFDIVSLVIIAFFALRTGIRGMVKELLSMAAVILGFLGAVLFSGFLAGYVEPQFGIQPPWSQIASFLGIFVVVYIVVKLFEGALNKIVERIQLESLDHALGFLLGVLEGIIVVMLLLTVLQWQNFFEVDAMIEDSLIARFLLPLLPYAKRLFSVQV